jgi:AAA domain
MRVAFSGSHRVGKTTLLEAVSARLPSYRVFEEPYRIMEDEGYEFSDPPAAEDFVRQLKRSLRLIEDAPKNALLDRCPLDFTAYLRALDEDAELDEWLPHLEEAMGALDLIVVVPIESPDRIELGAGEDRRFRAKADAWIKTLVLEDLHGFEIPTIEVHGDGDARLAQVLRAIR